MLTDEQRQQILEFCQQYEITRFWLLDSPLLNERVGAVGGPSAVVTFRPHWEAVPFQFARMERELAEIIGPETALHATGGLSQKFVEQVLSGIPTILPDPNASPASYAAIAKFCRKHHITKMWLLDDAVPNAECDRLKPSVIVATHPDYPMGMDVFSIQREIQALICVGASLYAYSGPIKPGISPKELNEIAEVWYAEPA